MIQWVYVSYTGAAHCHARLAGAGGPEWYLPYLTSSCPKLTFGRVARLLDRRLWPLLVEIRRRNTDGDECTIFLFLLRSLGPPVLTRHMSRVIFHILSR